MKLAVVVGGWHFPLHFYEHMTEAAKLARQAGHQVDLHCVMHRSPDCTAVRMEKLPVIPMGERYVKYDEQLYSEYLSFQDLRNMDWSFEEHPNTVGDWGFFNQWVRHNNADAYDVFLSVHDDCWFVNTRMLVDVLNGTADIYSHRGGMDPIGTVNSVPNWVMINNARDGKTHPHIRSCTFFTREFLQMIGGEFDLGDRVTRIGQDETPYGRMMRVLQDWNKTVDATQTFIHQNGLLDRCLYIGPYYRISKFLIECERGFVHWMNHGKKDVENGMKWLGLEP